MNTPMRASLILFTCAHVLGFVGVATAQLGVEWVARYNGPADSLDVPTGLSVDDSGNVYVAGSSISGRADPLNFDFDYATVKYSPSGDTVWVRRYSEPGNLFAVSAGLVLDGNGNAHVTGFSAEPFKSEDFATIKYSPTGDSLAVLLYDGPDNLSDHAAALALDDSGNVYVTGDSWGKTTFYDYATVKYAPNGQLLWVRRYNGPADSQDHPSLIKLDGGGNVYVSGRSIGVGTSDDYATVKYSPAGDTIWVRRYNGPADSEDLVRALEIDGAGNVFVTGWSRIDSLALIFEFATIKYAPTGDTLWVRTYSATGALSARAVDLALDDSGNVYVTGSTCCVGTGWDWSTIKYSPAGDALWVRLYDGPEGKSDFPRAMAVDDSGNVYVTGLSEGLQTGSDYVTIKYTSEGDTCWVRRYDGPASSYDSPWLIALDPRGNVYVTGFSTGIGTGYDYATLKYSNPTGDVNCDGIFDLSDVVLLGNYIDGLIDLTGTCGGGQADVDSDGDVDEDDYNLLDDIVAGVGP